MQMRLLRRITCNAFIRAVKRIKTNMRFKVYLVHRSTKKHHVHQNTNETVPPRKRTRLNEIDTDSE